MKYGWYIRNARSTYFVALAHITDTDTFSIGGANLRWVKYRRDALRFDDWVAGRDFLKRLDVKGPIPPGWHLIDYRECDLSTAPTADPRKVRTFQQVRDQALAEDRIREAIRRAHWTIRPAITALAIMGALWGLL